MKQRAFTLIELLVALSIIATVSIVAYVSYAGHMKTAYNATRISAIDSLHLSLSDYYQLKKTLPEPNSNSVSYDERGTYMHSLSGSYGVSGYVSNNFLPAGYVNFGATDPESNQFYAYGKLTDHTSFDVASVLYDEVTGAYKTYLRGTYPKQRLVSLIRSYSSSNFVSQNSTEDLPYNPYERKVTAYISSYSGAVTLTGNIGNINLNTPLIAFTGELNAGDTIILTAGSTALLHISDGSELSLGSTATETRLALNTLEYSDDHNLSSKVALYLQSGEVWTEAPHLRSETDSTSDFSIQTDSALAAVRGTVFGMSKNPLANTTAISLQVGKLEVEKVDPLGVKSPFTSGFTPSATGFVLADQKSYMIVPDGEQPIKLDGISNGGGASTSTGTLNPFEIEAKIQHPPFSLGYRPKAERISFTGSVGSSGVLSVTFHNPGADSYELSFGTGEIDVNRPFPNPNPNLMHTGHLPVSGPVTITGAFAYIDSEPIQRTYALRICFRGQCSAPDTMVIGGKSFDAGPFHAWGEQNVCPNKDQRLFPPFGCQDQKLVAYAPYDDDGDLTMYLKKNQTLGGTSTGILNRPKYRGYSIITSPNPDYFNTNDFELRPGTYPSILSKSLHNSFYQWGDTKGILVATGSGGTGTGSLQYNLASLNLGSNFAIEMRVRGGALQRGGTTRYYLWDDGTSDGMALYYYADYIGPRLVLTSKGWKIMEPNLTCNGTTSMIYSYCTSIWVFNFSDNTAFHTIRTEFRGTSVSFFLDGAPIGTIEITDGHYFSTQKIFIGNRLNSDTFIGQWNDIIDSVKIFSVP